MAKPAGVPRILIDPAHAAVRVFVSPGAGECRAIISADLLLCTHISCLSAGKTCSQRNPCALAESGRIKDED